MHVLYEHSNISSVHVADSEVPNSITKLCSFLLPEQEVFVSIGQRTWSPGMSISKREMIRHLEEQLVSITGNLTIIERQIAHVGGEMNASLRLLNDRETLQQQRIALMAEVERLRREPIVDLVPYVGLATFQETDAARFFGRTALVSQLVGRIQHESFLAVLGPSGSGKSSAVRAGLIPALKHGEIAGSEHWVLCVVTPGQRPLNTLAAALVALPEGKCLGDVFSLADRLRAQEDTLLLAADMVRLGQPNRRLVVVVDQGEELWTWAPEEPEARTAWIAHQQQPFIHQLVVAASAPTSPLRIIVAMRADFLHRVAEHASLAHWIQTHLILVSPLTAVELRESIVQPARIAGGDFEPGLVEELITQTQERTGALPLLEYTLLELWKARNSDGTMTWAAYHTLGGVQGALALRGDAILAEHYTTPEHLATLRSILLRLVRLGEGATDTRRKALLADLVPLGQLVEHVQALLTPLIHERLLTTGYDATSRAETIEISHEALIQAWPTFGRWIAESRNELRFLFQFEEAVKEWQASGESNDFLWTGLRLANALAWVTDAQPLLTARDQRFLTISRAVERKRRDMEAAQRREREQLRETRSPLARLRRYSPLLLLVFVIVSLLLKSQQETWNARAQLQMLMLADASLLEADYRTDHAQLLALAAYTIDTEANVPLVSRALYRAFGEMPIRTTLKWSAGTFEPIVWLSTAPQVLVSRADGTASIWDANNDRELYTLHGSSDRVVAAAWSEDEQYVLTGSIDGVARIWKVPTSTQQLIFDGHAGPVLAVAWSPDEKRVLTGSADGTARIWNAATGELLLTLQGHDGPVRVVAWRPDGNQLVTGSDDHTARVWNATEGTAVREDALVLRGHTGLVRAVAWSPDGNQVVTGSDDHTARVWDATEGAAVREDRLVLRGHTGPIQAVAWSPNGKQLLTGSADRTMQIWEAATGQTRGRAQQLDGSALAAVWDDFGWQVFAINPSGTTRIWHPDTRVIASEMIRHVCDQFQDNDVKLLDAVNVPDWRWRGCRVEQEKTAFHLFIYHRMRSGQ